MFEYRLPFAPGQPALWLRSGGSSQSQIFRGTITSVFDNRKCVGFQIPGSAVRVVSANSVTHGAFCFDCGIPGVVTAEGVRCPRCEQLAAMQPPPDAWVLLNWPVYHNSGPRLVGRAVRSGRTSLSLAEYRELMGQLNAERTQALEDHLSHSDYLDFLYRRGPFSNAGFAGHIERLAVLGDGANIAALLELPESSTISDEEALQLFFDFLEIGAAPPVQLRPLMPADDRTAGGEDETTDWLRRQMERGERRRAA